MTTVAASGADERDEKRYPQDARRRQRAEERRERRRVGAQERGARGEHASATPTICENGGRGGPGGADLDGVEHQRGGRGRTPRGCTTGTPTPASRGRRHDRAASSSTATPTPIGAPSGTPSPCGASARSSPRSSSSTRSAIATTAKAPTASAGTTVARAQTAAVRDEQRHGEQRQRDADRRPHRGDAGQPERPETALTREPADEHEDAEDPREPREECAEELGPAQQLRGLRGRRCRRVMGMRLVDAHRVGRSTYCPGPPNASNP